MKLQSRHKLLDWQKDSKNQQSFVRKTIANLGKKIAKSSHHLGDLAEIRLAVRLLSLILIPNPKYGQEKTLLTIFISEFTTQFAKVTISELLGDFFQDSFNFCLIPGGVTICLKQNIISEKKG